MIHFFRRIRQGLLSQNRFSKYMLYAVGEIALVMIGILLALQVNNWNEGKKLKFEENEVLREILEGLASDYKDVEENYLFQSSALRSQRLILKWRSGESQKSDSLYWHFANSVNFSIFLSNTAGFEALKSMGSFILRNNELKKRIVHLYEYTYARYELNQNLYMKFINSTIWDFNRNHFLNSDTTNDSISMYASFQIPVDVNSLRSSTEHGYLISSLEQYNLSLIERIKTVEKEITTIIDLIEDELKNKN